MSQKLPSCTNLQKLMSQKIFKTWFLYTVGKNQQKLSWIKGFFDQYLIYFASLYVLASSV